MNRLRHNSISTILKGLSESKVISLDASLRQLIEPVGHVVTSGGEELSLHILCCNEYALVTGLQSSDIENVREFAESIATLMAAKAQLQ